MNNKIKTLIVVIVVIAVAGTGITAYHLISTQKGQMITVDSGYNGTAPLTRIVSLDPAATATLYALGAYSTLVGGSVYDTYPSNNLTNVTIYPSMNLEAIYNLTPQAVISFTNYSGSQVSDLLNAGIDYIFLNSGSGSNFSLIEKQNTLLGQITGYSKNASLINAWMSTSLNKLYSSSANASAKNGEISGMYYLSSSGGIWTSGNHTFINEYFEYAHVKNIAASFDSGFYTISSGEVANSDPQLILLNQYVNISATTVVPFNDTPAVKNHNISYIPSSSLFDEPNFRDIFAVQWLIYKAYDVKVQLPQFPINLTENPDPVTLG